jgi:NADPH:quinone reductase-like Zn-dependent oxidoreductase
MGVRSASELRRTVGPSPDGETVSWEEPGCSNTSLSAWTGARVAATAARRSARTCRSSRAKNPIKLAGSFVLVFDRAQLSEIVQRVRDGRVRTNIGNVVTFDDAGAAFNPTERRKGKSIIRVRP